MNEAARTGRALSQEDNDFFETLSDFLGALGRQYVAVVAAADGGSPVLLSDLKPDRVAGVLREVLRKLDAQETAPVGRPQESADG